MISAAAPTEGWRAAMDAQVDIADFLRTRLGLRSIDAFARDVDGKGRIGGDLIRALTDFGPPSIIGAEPVWVDDNIVDLVQAAAETWVPEPLRVTDLIAPNGFVLMEKPLMLRDVWDKVVAYRAFSWQMAQYERTQQLGVILSTWSHIDDEDDYTREQDHEYVELLREAFGHHKFMLCHITPMWFNEPLPTTDADGYITENGHRIRLSGTLPVGPMTFFRLAQQRILERDRVRPDRAYRRAAQRRGSEDPYVTVIRLRRPKTQHDGEVSEVEWKQRWIVGGHWRRQPYGKAGEEPYYRHIWISPYIKGPADKPLELRELRAWEFKR